MFFCWEVGSPIQEERPGFRSRSATVEQTFIRTISNSLVLSARTQFSELEPLVFFASLQVCPPLGGTRLPLTTIEMKRR